MRAVDETSQKKKLQVYQYIMNLEKGQQHQANKIPESHNVKHKFTIDSEKQQKTTLSSFGRKHTDMSTTNVPVVTSTNSE